MLSPTYITSDKRIPKGLRRPDGLGFLFAADGDDFGDKFAHKHLGISLQKTCLGAGFWLGRSERNQWLLLRSAESL